MRMRAKTNTKTALGAEMLGKFFSKLDKHLRSQVPTESSDDDIRSIQDIELDVLALEDRILYSAVPMVDAEASPEPMADAVDAIDQLFVASSENTEGEPADGSLENEALELSNLDFTAIDSESVVEPAADGSSHELIVLQEGVDDIDQLIEDIVGQESDARTFEIVVLNSQESGFDQLDRILQDYSELDAIHIVSHGDDAIVQLGNTWLTGDNVEDYSEQLASWGMALGSEGDILIYGCDLAETSDGQSLIDSIAVYCDCDVAASDDLTGHAELGGDWILGVQRWRCAYGGSVQLRCSGQLASHAGYYQRLGGTL